VFSTTHFCLHVTDVLRGVGLVLLYWVTHLGLFESFNLPAPVLGAPRYQACRCGFLPGIVPRNIESMSTANPGQTISNWAEWPESACVEADDTTLTIQNDTDQKDTDQNESVARNPPDRVETGGENLLQMQRWEAIGRLTGGVVHDFNNLLTGVMLYCDLLLSSFDERDRRRRYADEIRSATIQATDLVQQLLVFARPQPSPTHPLNLSEIAAAMCDLARRLIGENIALELHLDPQLGAVEIARSQAQQLLLNLVLNSRDALPNGGRIVIETSNCALRPVAGLERRSPVTSFPCVLLVVEDNGLGMSAETRGRLFEPFFTTKPAARGGGLGLTTVRSIVTAHRGVIHFESEPGRGTRAMILFPRLAASRSPELPVEPVQGPPATTTPLQEAKRGPLV
jgi:signal transduction histidine kinase